MSDYRKILEQVRDGEVSVEEALLVIKKKPFEDIGYAKVDHHRGVRQGAPEVIFGAGKEAKQIAGIIDSMKKKRTGDDPDYQTFPEEGKESGKTLRTDLL